MTDLWRWYLGNISYNFYLIIGWGYSDTLEARLTLFPATLTPGSGYIDTAFCNSNSLMISH